MTDLKLCANCNELKSLDEYHKHIRKPKQDIYQKQQRQIKKKSYLSLFREIQIIKI